MARVRIRFTMHPKEKEYYMVAENLGDAENWVENNEEEWMYDLSSYIDYEILDKESEFDPPEEDEEEIEKDSEST